MPTLAASPGEVRAINSCRPFIERINELRTVVDVLDRHESTDGERVERVYDLKAVALEELDAAENSMVETMCHVAYHSGLGVA